MSTVRRFLLVLAGLCFLPSLPGVETPRTAVLDFINADSPGSEDSAIVDLSRAIQGKLLTRDDFAWIERQEFDRVVREADLSGLGLVSQVSAVRLGHWLRADLLLRGQISRLASGGGELTIEVVDLKRAELLTARKVAVPTNRRGSIRPEAGDIQRAADAAASALEEARSEIQNASGRRTIAPLFFRNIGATERLNFLEPRLTEAIAQIATPESGSRMLRFSRPGAAGGESELVLAGLTDTDPDAWQKVADVYVWGTFAENGKDGAAFDDVPVTISLQVWSGSGEPREVRWEGQVRDLDRGVQTVASGAVATAQAGRLIATRNEADRRKVASWLTARAGEAKAQIDRNLKSVGGTSVSNFLAAPLGRQLWGYRVRLLEVACFFDPLNRPLQEERMEAAWNAANPQAPADPLRRMWLCFADRQAHARRFGRKPDGSLDGDLVLLQTRTIQSLMKLAQDATCPPEANGFTHEEEMVRQIRSIIALWCREIDTANRAGASHLLTPQWLEIANHEWFEAAFGFSSGPMMFRELELDDAIALRNALEEVWPWLKQEAGRCLRSGNKSAQRLVNCVFSICGAFADEARASVLLDAAWSAAGESSGPSALAAQPKAARLGPPRIDKPWAKIDAAPQQRLPGQPAGPAFPALNAVFHEISLLPFVTYEVARGDGELFRRKRQGLIDSLAVSASFLWVGESGRPLPAEAGAPNPQGDHYLWRYDPALRSARLFTPELGGHSAIRGIVSHEADLWLGLDADGVWRWNPAEANVRRFRGEDGLVTSRILAAEAGGGRLSFLGGVPPDLLIAQYQSEGDRWLSIKVPAPSIPSAAAALWGEIPFAIATCGKWLCVTNPLLAFYDSDAGTWGVPGGVPPLSIPASLPSDPMPSQASIAGRNPIWVATRCLTGDESAFWIGQSGSVLRYDPRAPAEKKAIPLPGFPVAAVHDGPWLWLVVQDWSGNLKLALVDKRSAACTGVLDLPIKGLSKIAAAGNRVWVGGSALFEINLREDAAISHSTPPSIDHRLIRAAANGDVTTVNRAIAEKADLELASESGWTPLLAAVETGRREIVRNLLGAGANPNRLSRDGASPLQLAAEAGDQSLVEILLAGGARPDLNPGVVVRGLAKIHDSVSPPPPYLDATVAPRCPVNLRAAVSELGDVVLTWEDGSANTSRFEVFRQDRSDQGLRNIAYVGAGGTTWTDTAPPQDTAGVDYEVIAFNGAGKTGSNQPSAKIHVAMPKYAAVSAGRLNLYGSESEVKMSRLWESQTPLMAAIGAGRNEIVRLLLSAHADPNLQDGIGQTPLLLAVRSGNYESARLLLAQGARADLADALGDTPAYAAYERHDDQALLREILAAMPPQVRSNEASRLILIAANRNQIRDLELLLSLGGELSACTIYGESALSQACGPQNEETVVWLIQHGFPLHRKTLKDVSRVVELADVALQRAIQCGAAGCVGALLDAGIEVNHTIQGRPLLAYAVETGNHGMIQLLLERGANQRQKSAEGKLPVDFAANADVRSWLSATPVRPSSWPLPTTVSALSNSHSDFSRDADPLKKQVNSQLISACKRDDIPGAVEAISAGAEIDARDESGMTPLTHALKTRSFKTARWLIENGAAVNRLTKSQCAPLSFAIEANSPDLAAALLREGADPNLLGFRGFTPLMLAVRTGNRSMVDLLLDAGADANLAGWQSDFLYREPPLAGALAEGHADLVELLLTRGADSHAQSYSFLSTRTGIVKEPQPSLLMFAAAGGNLELVQRMIAFGQDPRFQDKENNDALAWAAGRGRDKVVEFLLPLVGHSPHALEMAYRSGKTSTIELLRRAGYQ